MRVTKKIRAEQLAILEETYRGAKPELIFRNPFELLIAVILSAQCTDKRVNVTTKRLFRQGQVAGGYRGDGAPRTRERDPRLRTLPQ